MIETRVLDRSLAATTPPVSGKRSWWRRRAVARAQRHQAELQHYLRQIGSQLILQGRPEPPWLIGVTSAIPGEGKTTVAYGLAATLANDLPERVVLVELDFARPILAAELDLAPTPGLAEVIEQGLSLTVAARSTHLPNLTVVPAGQPASEVPQLVHNPALDRVWPQLGQLGSIVICDLPAVLATPVTAFLTQPMTTLLLTVRAGVTPTSLVQAALRQLDATRVAGVVLNGEQTRLPRWLAQLMGEV